MLGTKKFEPKLIYKLTLDDLVPQDNIYRLLDKFLDLRFLYKDCKNLYGKTGKPSIDPVVFFKLQIFGYLENIISDRELIRRAGDSLSARYFIGYDMDEILPWHSTISRTRGIMGKDLFDKIFNKVLELCNNSGLIAGNHQTIDSTLVKANASMENLERRSPNLSIREYIDKTYGENNNEEKKDTKEEDDSNDNGNKETEKKKLSRNDLFRSKTDPDSKIISKSNKPSELYYTTQYCADTKNRIITDVLTTVATTYDSNILLEVLNRAQARLSQFNLIIEKVSADKGYCSGKNLRELEQKGVSPYIPAPRTRDSRGDFSNKEFKFKREEDVYICPNEKMLKYSSYEPQKESKRYRANAKDCSGCKLKESCCPFAKSRTIRQTIYYEEYERLSQRMKTREGKQAARLRRIISEGLFAEAKNSHGLKKFMSRGLDKVQKRSYMIATVQNLKRLLKTFRRNREISACNLIKFNKYFFTSAKLSVV